jgi:hypothetical protein
MNVNDADDPRAETIGDAVPDAAAETAHGPESAHGPEPAAAGALPGPLTDASGLPDAGALHRALRQLQGAGNKVRLAFLDTLRLLFDGSLFVELGYSSFQQYCDQELHLARSTAYEYIRVVCALDGLPRVRDQFEHGALSWDQVRSITRVASPESELAWIDFAFEQTVSSLVAEVREAQRTGRDAPRKRRYGLPNLTVRLCLELSLEDMERVRAAFALVGHGGGPDLGSGPADTRGAGRDHGDGSPPGHEARDLLPGNTADDARPALVRWADGILSGAIPASPVGAPGSEGGSGSGPSAARPTPAQSILYRACPVCREATLDTADGPVSISPARLAELEPVCRQVTIDDAAQGPGVDAPADPAQGRGVDASAAAAKSAGEEPGADHPDGKTIDQPNTAKLTRQVLHRDGLRCANPGCGRRRNLHAHHIVFRSHGGPTSLSNEVTVCDTCHALIHRGLLEVSGSPDEGLRWRRKPLASDVELRDVDALREQLRALVERAPETATSGQSRRLAAGPRFPAPTESTIVDSGPASRAAFPITRQRVLDLAEGLVAMGCRRSEAEERVRYAVAALMTERAAASRAAAPGAEPAEAAAGSPAVEPLDDESILLRAMRWSSLAA